ncbi:MAG: alginate lyase family protein, partial [Candidatus Latescibacteria bacterium]|nr:alginate lyase family protein [Candidatus Latescibacterota bacterium]
MATMEQITSDLIGGAAGPCLVICEDDVSAIKKKIADNDWAAQAFASLETQAKGWIDQPIDIPERGGQWPHWYACEDCGTRLETASPTEHLCSSCDRVYTGEPWDSVPLTEVHNGLSQAALSLGVYFALTGDRDAAHKVAEILLGYAERYPHYEIRDHNLASDTRWATKVSWGTLGESVWLIPICGGYDLIRDAGVLTPADYQTIRQQLLRPAARLILKHDIGIHNIQCWHNAAIGAAGLMLRDRDLVGFAVEGDVGIRAQIRKGILSDGFWHEGSWGYHFYGMRPLLAWME